MKRTYQRSFVLEFNELNIRQQIAAIDELGQEEAQETKYVIWLPINADHDAEALPLSMFMRTDNGLFTGYYGLTAFSCYFIKLSRNGEEATVVYAYC